MLIMILIFTIFHSEIFKKTLFSVSGDLKPRDQETHTLNPNIYVELSEFSMVSQAFFPKFFSVVTVSFCLGHTSLSLALTFVFVIFFGFLGCERKKKLNCPIADD